MAMIRTQTYITDEQHAWLEEIAATTQKTVAEHIREAIDRYKAQTGYIHETIEMAEDVHPEMTYDQFLGWLQFRWRLKYEGKEHNGAEIHAKLDEILEILRRNDAPDY